MFERIYVLCNYNVYVATVITYVDVIVRSFRKITQKVVNGSQRNIQQILIMAS